MHVEEVQQTGACGATSGQRRQARTATQVDQATAQGQATDIQKTRLPRDWKVDKRRTGATTRLILCLLTNYFRWREFRVIERKTFNVSSGSRQPTTDKDNNYKIYT